MDDLKIVFSDVDGTLLDSMSVWEDIGERNLASQNITAEKNLRAALHTMSLEQGAAWMKEKYQLDKSISQIIEEVLKIVSDFYRFEAPLKPGVKKTLEWFKERNIQMTVATSGNRELTEAALARNGILDYFEQIYTCTETGAGKDEPLIYLKAAESMQAEPNETLVFEDALHAIKTAKKAGFRTVGIYDRYSEKDQKEIQGTADIYIESWEQSSKLWQGLKNNAEKESVNR